MTCVVQPACGRDEKRRQQHLPGCPTDKVRHPTSYWFTERTALEVGAAYAFSDAKAYKSDAEGKFTGLTDVGGAFSLCTKIPITKLVAVRLRGEDYMYSAKLRFEDPVDPSNNFRFDSRFQNDLLFSAGLQFAFRSLGSGPMRRRVRALAAARGEHRPRAPAARHERSSSHLARRPAAERLAG